MRKIIEIRCIEEGEDNRPVPFNASIEKILDIILNNPFGKFEKMSQNAESLWEEINIKKIIQLITKNKKQSFSFRSDTLKMNASISKNPMRNTFVFTPPPSDFFYLDEQQFIDFFLKISGNIPNLTFGRAECKNPEYVKCIDESDIMISLSRSFGLSLGYAHILTPNGYKNELTREDIINIPNLDELQELNNGIFFIKIYSKPFSYDENGVISKMEIIGKYLNERRIKR